MDIYINNYTTYSDIDNIDDFWDHIESVEQDDILAMVTMEHERTVGQLDPGTDIQIDCIHPQEDTFKATETGAICFDVSCDLFVEYSVIALNQ